MATGGHARSRPIVPSTSEAHPGKSPVRGSLFHCPACGSEVLPAGSGPALGENSRAYRAGWMDGRYGETGSIAHNDQLAEWQEWRDRLDYYWGHRAGREARPVEDERFPKAS